MPAVARIGDFVNTVHNSGSGCPSPQIIAVLTGSPDVFINNIPAHRLLDLNTPHDHCPPFIPTQLITGSSNVFINNLQTGRVGDVYSCGAQVIAGSPDVFANN